MRKLGEKTLSELRATYYWDRDAADRVVRFFENHLVHIEGELAGQPIQLERWQRRLLRRAYGWKKRSDGTRRFRTVFVFIPRKNGKSLMGSGIGLYMLAADQEPGAQVVSAACDKKQAGVIFDVAKKMVKRSSKLSKLLQTYKSSIVYEQADSNYIVLSADADSKHGANLHAIMFDELHTQPNRHLMDVLKTSTGARRQPMLWIFTTAGYDIHSICYDYYDYAKKVASLELDDPSFLACIYEAPRPKEGEPDQWGNPAMWKAANPNLGVSIKNEYMEQQYKEALHSKAYENTFRRLHLNQWTSQETKWLPMDKWDQCATTIDEFDFHGDRCWIGLDLSSTTDLTSYCLVFKRTIIDSTFSIVAIPRFFVPIEGIEERELRDKVPYRTWAQRGHIVLTPGDAIDYKTVMHHIDQDAQRFDIEEIAFDRWGATQMMQELDEAGLKVFSFGQGYSSMSAPSKELLKIVVSRQFQHGGNPALRWNADNVVVETDPAGNIKPNKRKSTQRIDGIVALIMGLDRATRDERGSIYRDRGIIRL